MTPDHIDFWESNIAWREDRLVIKVDLFNDVWIDQRQSTYLRLRKKFG